MDSKQVSDFYHFNYDPYLYGIDTTFFRVLDGGSALTISNGKIGIQDSNVSSLRSFMMGSFEFCMTVPTAPAAGDFRIFGLYQRSYGNRNAAYFFVSGSNFYARSYADDGVLYDQTTISWDSSWTNVATVFEIRWYINKVEFWIRLGSDERKVATHEAYFPKQVLLPVYFSNSIKDTLIMNYVSGGNIRKTFIAVTGSAYDGSASPSASSSESASVSSSPSSSPSTSDSASVSASPSSSESASASSSPSASESASPSASESSSPSESPSASESNSPSASESASPSESPSTSVSASPSASPSVSGSPSSSPSA